MSANGPDVLHTKRDIEEACNDLATCSFFPHEARSSVMLLLAKMCPHRRALRWLTEEVVNHIGKWPGPAELRGLLCTRFDPADGVDQWCSLPGYSPQDAEQRHLSRHLEQKTQEQIGGSVGEFEEPIRRMSERKTVPLLSGEVPPEVSRESR